MMLTENLDVLATKAAIRGGQDRYGGVFFADKSETSIALVPGLCQYVGHTKVPSAVKIGNDRSCIYFLDCLNTEEKYLEVDLYNNGIFLRRLASR